MSREYVPVSQLYRYESFVALGNLNLPPAIDTDKLGLNVAAIQRAAELVRMKRVFVQSFTEPRQIMPVYCTPCNGLSFEKGKTERPRPLHDAYLLDDWATIRLNSAERNTRINERSWPFHNDPDSLPVQAHYIDEGLRGGLKSAITMRYREQHRWPTLMWAMPLNRYAAAHLSTDMQPLAKAL